MSKFRFFLIDHSRRSATLTAVMLPLSTLHEILACDPSNESYWAILSFRIVSYVVQSYKSLSHSLVWPFIQTLYTNAILFIILNWRPKKRVNGECYRHLRLFEMNYKVLSPEQKNPYPTLFYQPLRKIIVVSVWKDWLDNAFKNLN